MEPEEQVRVAQLILELERSKRDYVEDSELRVQPSRLGNPTTPKLLSILGVRFCQCLEPLEERFGDVVYCGDCCELIRTEVRDADSE